MIACDASVSLRTYGLGQASAGLTDAISAGLPTVASAELAEICEAPSYVLRVPDPFSPLLVAERLAEIHACGEVDRDPEERRAYCREHSFDYYARRLGEILGLA